MFFKTTSVSRTVAQQIRKLSKQKVLASTESELLESLEDSLLANADSALDDTKADSTAIAAEFRSTGLSVVVAVTAGKLFAVRDDEPEAILDLWWHEVDRAIWDPESLILKVVLATDAHPIGLRLSERHPLEFLSLLRERVENSVVISETIPLTSAENVRIAVRRDQFGELIVQAIADPGVDVNHPIVRKMVEPVVARLREVSGAR